MARTPGTCWNPRGLLGPQHTVLLAVIWTHSKIAPAFWVFMTTGTTQVLYICHLADVRNFETRHWILMHVQECDYQVIRCSEWKFAAHLPVIYRLFLKGCNFQGNYACMNALVCFFYFFYLDIHLRSFNDALMSSLLRIHSQYLLKEHGLILYI